MGVVDRHGPAEAAKSEVVVQRRDRVHVGDDRLAHAQVRAAVAEVAVLDRAHSVGGVLEAHLGQDLVGVDELDPVQVAVQPVEVERVQHVVVELEPVEVEVADQGRRDAALVGHLHAVEAAADL